MIVGDNQFPRFYRVVLVGGGDGVGVGVGDSPQWTNLTKIQIIHLRNDFLACVPFYCMHFIQYDNHYTWNISSIQILNFNHPVKPAFLAMEWNIVRSSSRSFLGVSNSATQPSSMTNILKRIDSQVSTLLYINIKLGNVITQSDCRWTWRHEWECKQCDVISYWITG